MQPEPFDSEQPGTLGQQPWGAAEDTGRQAARQRLEKKRAWTRSFLAYCVVNTFLVGIWLFSGRGYFWPGWVLAGWGIAEVMSYFDAFRRKPISEADIDAEMRRT